jgi:hypothetical protein
LTSIGALISVMTLLSTFETSCGCFSWRQLPSGCSPLNTLIPNAWSCLWTLHASVNSNKSLEHIGLLDHLAVWSCITLPHRLGPLIKLQLSRMENEQHVATTKHDFKCQAWHPTGHFKKLLRATCPNHAYPLGTNLKSAT